MMPVVFIFFSQAFQVAISLHKIDRVDANLRKQVRHIHFYYTSANNL